MTEPPDFEAKRAERERRHASIDTDRLVAKAALLPPEGQEKFTLMLDAVLVADEEELAQLKAATAAGERIDVERVLAIAADVLRRHGPPRVDAAVSRQVDASDSEGPEPGPILTLDGRLWPCIWCDNCHAVRQLAPLQISEVDQFHALASVDLVCAVCAVIVAVLYAQLPKDRPEKTLRLVTDPPDA